jgi:hypothetical protein
MRLSLLRHSKEKRAATRSRSKKRERWVDQIDELPRKSFKGQSLDFTVLGMGMFTDDTTSSVTSET